MSMWNLASSIIMFVRILYNNNQICAICKNEIHSIDDSTVDHIIPHNKGGKTVIDNAQLTHRSCAARKYTRLVEGTIGDNGLPEAQILLNVGHIAAAGATAGLVLERHLKLLCNQQQPPLILGKSDGISKVNDALRNTGIYDTAQWRQIQWMADVRNSCDHPGTNPPTRENVDDLIKIVKSLLTSFPLTSNAQV